MTSKMLLRSPLPDTRDSWDSGDCTRQIASNLENAGRKIRKQADKRWSKWLVRNNSVQRTSPFLRSAWKCAQESDGFDSVEQRCTAPDPCTKLTKGQPTCPGGAPSTSEDRRGPSSYCAPLGPLSLSHFSAHSSALKLIGFEAQILRMRQNVNSLLKFWIEVAWILPMQSAHYLFSIKKSVVSRKKCKTDLHPWLRAGQEGEALAVLREQGETGIPGGDGSCPFL